MRCLLEKIPSEGVRSIEVKAEDAMGVVLSIVGFFSYLVGKITNLRTQFIVLYPTLIECQRLEHAALGVKFHTRSQGAPRIFRNGKTFYDQVPELKFQAAPSVKNFFYTCQKLRRERISRWCGLHWKARTVPLCETLNLYPSTLADLAIVCS